MFQIGKPPVIIHASNQRESIGKENQMDARLIMSGMTDFFRHPRQSSAGLHPPLVIPRVPVSGIPLPFGHTRSLWRVSIRKELKMDSR